MAKMTIGEVAERAGLQPSALRYYESAGLLPRPERVNGRRRYDPEIIYLLRAIGIAKQAGFTIEEMRQLFREREASEPFSRSEEHTSELQSCENLVCRLLLEKKKVDDVNLCIAIN